MSGQRIVDRYVRIRISLVKKQYTSVHGVRMNDKAHGFWKNMTADERTEAMAALMERLAVSEEKS